MVFRILIHYNPETECAEVTSDLNETATMSIMDKYLQLYAPADTNTDDILDVNHYYVMLLWDSIDDKIDCEHNCGSHLLRDGIIMTAISFGDIK